MTNELENENKQKNCFEQNSESTPAPIDPEFFILEGSFLNESIVSTELFNIRELCESNKNDINQLKDVLSKLADNQQKQFNNFENYISIVADCQKQTAGFANAVLERHALHPAIETVFTLRNLLQDLSEQSVNLIKKESTCYLFSQILNSISEAVKIANDKCEYLGIEKISPDELDDFNAQEHEIKQPVATDDNSRHKKIHQTLIPGLMYRSKVLKFAQVSVYCLKN